MNTQYITITKIQENAIADMNTISAAKFETEKEFVKYAENQMIKMCEQNTNFDKTDEELVEETLENGYYEYDDNGTKTTICITWS